MYAQRPRVVVRTRHDELAAHDVQFMPAHRRRAVRRIRIDARAEAELVVRHVEHPLRDRLVRPVRDSGGDVPADGVSASRGAVRVELAAAIVAR